MSENVSENNLPAILINNQFIKDLSLEIPHAPEIFSRMKQPEMNIEIDVKTKDLGDSNYGVLLNVSMNGDIGTEKLFILELSYGASVHVNVPQNHIEPVLAIEIPRLLFPFARNIITQCLVEGGLPPIMLNPIDFAAVYANRQKMEAEKED